MNWDLHCHSTVSDGLLSPARLAWRARANGVDALALTDHDDTAGLAEAQAAARAAGIRFIPGVEISVTWNERSVHIVGLDVDPAHAPLREGLARVRSGRLGRALRIAEALARVGIEGCLEGALRHAGRAHGIGRTHFARYLVERNVARDLRSVFRGFLARGKPGYVPHQWASLEDAVSWIAVAGGVAVIAHPARYRFDPAQTGRLFEEFRRCGGAGIELESGGHATQATRLLAGLARDLDLAGSRGSDFHGPGESRAELGRLAELPPGVRPIWSVLRPAAG
ncbi:MAG: PHP domain-containing protein [Burkholderiales bacterium]|nr:PHP domain-containing protein [Burkholderiales bacterium]